jgi:hypothetical protein
MARWGIKRWIDGRRKRWVDGRRKRWVDWRMGGGGDG